MISNEEARINFVENIITRLNEVEVKVDENEKVSSLKELKKMSNPSNIHTIEKAIINLLILKGIKELNLNVKQVDFYATGGIQTIKFD